MIKAKFLIVFFFMLQSCLALAANSPVSNEDKMKAILDFWFDYSNHPEPFYNRAQWWEKNATFDNLIREKFADTRKQAINGELDDWLQTPKGTLAYIILIDQFSRNLFRGSKEMYQYDYLALNAAKRAIEQGFDKSLSFIERVFIYLPFEHSEQIEDQKESVKLFSQLAKEVPSEFKPQAEQYLSYAKDHFDVIDQFQRFPHRNTILGRTTTEEEAKFLEKHPGY